MKKMRILGAILLPVAVSAAAIGSKRGTLVRRQTDLDSMWYSWYGSPTNPMNSSDAIQSYVSATGLNSTMPTEEDLLQALANGMMSLTDMAMNGMSEVMTAVYSGLMASVNYMGGLMMSGINYMGGVMNTAVTSMFINTTPYFLATEHLVSTTQLNPEIRTNSKRIQIKWGPQTIQPAFDGMSLTNLIFSPGTSMWNGLVQGIPTDATILWVNTTVVFEDGRDATINDGLYLHHWGLYDMDKTGKLIHDCWGLTPARPQLIVGGAEDKGDNYFTSPDGMFNSGFYVGPDDRLMVTAEAVNYSNEPKDIYSLIEIEYVPGRIPGAMDIGIQSFSVTGCGIMVGFMPEQNETHQVFKGEPVTLINDGWIVSSKGHVHDGGVNVVTKLNGDVICDSRAIYGDSPTIINGEAQGWKTIQEMTKCEEPVRVRKGDTINLESIYDFRKFPSRQHVHGGEAEQMGIMFVTFAYDPDLPLMDTSTWFTTKDPEKMPLVSPDLTLSTEHKLHSPPPAPVDEVTKFWASLFGYRTMRRKR